MDNFFKLQPLENDHEFKRDPYSGAFINVNVASVMERKEKIKSKEKITQLEGEINNLRNDIKELKQLIQQMSK